MASLPVLNCILFYLKNVDLTKKLEIPKLKLEIPTLKLEF